MSTLGLFTRVMALIVACAGGAMAQSMSASISGNTIVINHDMQLPRPYDNR
jgi:hypothetical protein